MIARHWRGWTELARAHGEALRSPRQHGVGVAKMSIRSPFRLVVWFLILFCVLAATAEKISDIHPTSYVTDLAGVIDSATAARINAYCSQVEQTTGAQIAVVTVRSLEGESVEVYAVDLFKHLGVGKKDNRGVLLLLAPSEKRYRLEVGYGLEPVITDARAGDIGREIVPLLRQNRYSAGLELGVQRLGDLIGGKNIPRRIPAAATSRPSVRIPWFILPLGIFAIIGVLRAISAAATGNRRRSSGLWWIGPGGGFGGGGFGGGGFGGSSGGFGGFGGGESGGGGASGSW
jgi:uncharacterized protein